MQFTVAIDGPAAAGKGTISRAIAREFGFAHLDTGLLYRAVGAKGGNPVLAAQELTPDDLARADLRSLEAGEAASRVAAIPEVRAALVAFQRDFARREGGAVLDGRDIGTVIFPMAEVKLFVTATPETRARRRWLEADEKSASYEDVLNQVRERDARDMGRADAPLRPADDAVLLDTTEMSIAQAVDAAKASIARKLAQVQAQKQP
ncbi:(d)CMP kinase [Roseinatronobacter alkalisoli]|uniref:Cytidylate kinase n=1 Tax=Roseinatronobacter alkalisoli TaxID=3028235 RepID=A0ABT5T6H6_9RHOB|nr:d(CMP) kinase [Roseinatronobacter sp. HJB301]MDD7970310.1 d(CMP) kinase [Roseinatronobacter sp. HJB301]